ncbi:MAG: hypothetical protein P8Z41_12460 [Anaerolineales bacterium]
MARSSATRSGSVDASPSAVLTAIGKKQTSTTMITLGINPKPNQMISKGDVARLPACLNDLERGGQDEGR